MTMALALAAFGLQLFALLHMLVAHRGLGAIAGAALFALAVFPADQAPWELLLASVALTALSAVLAIIVVAPHQPSFSRGAGAPFALLLAFVAVLLGVTVVTGSANPLRVLAIFVPGIALAMLAVRMTVHDRRTLGWWLLLLCGTQLGVAALEVFAGLEPVWGVRNTERLNPFVDQAWPRAQGTLGHPIVLSLLMVLATAFALRHENALTWPLRAGLIGIGVAGIALSGTRAALVALAAFLVLHLLTDGHVVRWLRNMLAVGIAAGVVLYPGSGIIGFAESAIESGSFQHRADIAGEATRLLAQDDMPLIFGHGAGSTYELFQTGVLVSPDGFDVVDNTLVFVLAVSGVLGLLLCCAMVLALLLAGRSDVRLYALVFAVYAFSFDLITWVIAMALFGVLCMQARARDVAPLAVLDAVPHAERRRTATVGAAA